MSKEFPILPLTLRERCFVARVRLGSFALFDDRYKRLGQQVVGEERKWTLQFVPFLFRLLQSAAFLPLLPFRLFIKLKRISICLRCLLI